MNPVLLGSLAALCWGTLDFMAGTTSRAIGAIRVTAAVNFIGLLFISLWLVAFGEFPGFQHDRIWWPLITGVAYALATLFLFAAIASGPVSLAVPITMSYPATSVILAMFLGNWPSLLQLLFVAVILAGVLLVALGEHDNGESTPPSRRWRTFMFAFLAHLTFVFAVFMGQTSATIFGEVETTWISRLAGAAAMLPLIPLSQGLGKAQIRFLPLLCVMALLDTVAAVLLFAAGKTAHPELATVCGAASGAITVVLAWIFLSERIVYLRWFGIAATFAGIAALSALK